MASREKTEQIRQEIVRSADQLFYQKGYNLTSFSDIASASNIPRGNLNYHFKTKDQVLAAVIDNRVKVMKAMLKRWDVEYDTALQRLKRYALIAVNEKSDVVLYGCPMGTLNLELGKVQPGLRDITREQFVVFERWIKKQFKAMETDADPAELAMRLMVWTQGIATMAYVHQDARMIKREVDAINTWLDSL